MLDNGLSQEVNQLLTAWKKQIDRNAVKHKKQAVWAKLYEKIVGLIATVFSVFVSSSILYDLKECTDVICIIKAICSSIATLATGVSTVMQFGNKLQEHKDANARYLSLSKNIETILITKNDESRTLDILNNIRAVYDDISNTSPVISDDEVLRYKIFDRVERVPVDPEHFNCTTRRKPIEPTTVVELPKDPVVVVPPNSLAMSAVVSSASVHELQPATTVELETINKQSSEICVDLNLGTNYVLDPVFKYQLDLFNNNFEDRV